MKFLEILFKILKPQIFILGIIIFISCSCSKIDPRCWGKDKNKGIIDETILISCDFEPPSLNEQYVITSDSAYQSFVSNNTVTSICDTPSMDFNQYTLLGVYTVGECNVKYKRRVERNENKSKYHYEVKVKSCGTCKKATMTYNWVLVPKLPDNWNVTFDVVYK